MIDLPLVAISYPQLINIVHQLTDQFVSWQRRSGNQNVKMEILAKQKKRMASMADCIQVAQSSMAPARTDIYSLLPVQIGNLAELLNNSITVGNEI